MTAEEKTVWGKLLGNTAGLSDNDELSNRHNMHELWGFLVYLTTKKGFTSDYEIHKKKAENMLKVMEQMQASYDRIYRHAQLQEALVKEQKKIIDDLRRAIKTA